MVSPAAYLLANSTLQLPMMLAFGICCVSLGMFAILDYDGTK
jgi:hypothetical protein